MFKKSLEKMNILKCEDIKLFVKNEEEFGNNKIAIRIIKKRKRETTEIT